MILWRISNHENLSGAGGLRSGGRWHSKGVPIVYMAESAALALLETLVHFEARLEDLPSHYKLLKVDYSSEEGLSDLALDTLPEHWTQDQNITRTIGDEWLAAQYSALLKVPSAVVPQSFNYLFNPRHASAGAATIASVSTHPFDTRLLSTMKINTAD